MLGFAACARQGTSPAGADVLTHHNDGARSGATLVETALKPSLVAGGAFGRLFERDVDGGIVAQPLVLHGVPTRRPRPPRSAAGGDGDQLGLRLRSRRHQPRPGDPARRQAAAATERAGRPRDLRRDPLAAGRHHQHPRRRRHHADTLRGGPQRRRPPVLPARARSDRRAARPPPAGPDRAGGSATTRRQVQRRLPAQPPGAAPPERRRLRRLRQPGLRPRLSRRWPLPRLDRRLPRGRSGRGGRLLDRRRSRARRDLAGGQRSGRRGRSDLRHDRQRSRARSATPSSRFSSPTRRPG